jgi:hypothetical protein
MGELRAAPTGFTEDAWERFCRDGFLVVPDALGPGEVERLSAVVAGHSRARGESDSFDVPRAVEVHPELERLIDHDAHIGYAYDLYGEATKLLLSQFFVRPPNAKKRNEWHFDGPRLLPFEVFSPRLPLRLKVGYWLTPLPRRKMGNLLYVPGSHHASHLPQYRTHEAHPQERALLVEPGAMTLMWSGLWHRVEENASELTRMNVFLEYGPTWITAADRFGCDPAWRESLPRERRILMRAYEHPNSLIKPPEEDVPLFLPREAGLGPDVAAYSDAVPAHLRKHRTWAEARL